MTIPAQFFDKSSGGLTPEAFDFVLQNELKRAVRSQNFVTLVLMGPRPLETEGEAQGAGDRAAHEIARVVSQEVRETDFLSHTSSGLLSLLLLDADLPSSMCVVNRLISRLEHYTFQHPVSITLGAACCPTDGADADSLRRAAEAHPVGQSAGRQRS